MPRNDVMLGGHYYVHPSSCSVQTCFAHFSRNSEMRRRLLSWEHFKFCANCIESCCSHAGNGVHPKVCWEFGWLNDLRIPRLFRRWNVAPSDKEVRKIFWHCHLRGLVAVSKTSLLCVPHSSVCSSIANWKKIGLSWTQRMGLESSPAACAKPAGDGCLTSAASWYLFL